MTIKRADPLPECHLCDRPTARAVAEANAGLCSDCVNGIADTIRMLPVGVTDLQSERWRRGRLQRLADDRADVTTYVEGYRPPVPQLPGQLALPVDDDGPTS